MPILSQQVNDKGDNGWIFVGHDDAPPGEGRRRGTPF
jgi:hypothetical protein